MCYWLNLGHGVHPGSNDRASSARLLNPNTEIRVFWKRKWGTDIGNATSDIYHVPYFMDGNLRPKRKKAFPSHNRAGTTTQHLICRPYIVSTLLLLLVQANLHNIEWWSLWVQTNQFLPKPEWTRGITFQTCPMCFQSKENKSMP